MGDVVKELKKWIVDRQDFLLIGEQVGGRIAPMSV